MKILKEQLKYSRKQIDKIEDLCASIKAIYKRDGDYSIIIYQQNYNYTEPLKILFRIKADMCMSAAGLFEFSSDTLDIKPCWLRIKDIKHIILGAF